jgi:hypothetical protein
MSGQYEPETHKVAGKDIWFRCMPFSGYWQVQICSDEAGTPIRNKQDDSKYTSHSEACEAAERMAREYGTKPKG